MNRKFKNATVLEADHERDIETERAQQHKKRGNNKYSNMSKE